MRTFSLQYQAQVKCYQLAEEENVMFVSNNSENFRTKHFLILGPETNGLCSIMNGSFEARLFEIYIDERERVEYFELCLFNLEDNIWYCFNCSHAHHSHIIEQCYKF